MDEIEKYVKAYIEERNQKSVKDFEGYSPDEMHFILYDFFSAKCPVQLQKLSDKEYTQIPMLSQIKFLIDRIKDKKGLKLTATGNLPTKVVKELYGQGFLKDYFAEKGLAKVYKEEDLPVIRLPRLILELSEIVKKRNNVLSITKKGESIIQSDQKLFAHIFEIFCTKFNWSYFDNFENERIGQMGFGFSLILLDKYGETQRDVDFYTKKYAEAFRFEYNASSQIDFLSSPYPIRTFDRFLDYFGLIELKGVKYKEQRTVATTPLFKKLIKVRPHQKGL